MDGPKTDEISSLPPWQFAGWGAARRIEDVGEVWDPETAAERARHSTLGEVAATAICGNDITSSCLYVAALCAAHAGVLAPVVLLIVAGVLYLYRKVYAEVGSALPLNGGCYTVLLNTTNKRTAAGAACLTVLSYVATAVISAGEAMHYAHHLWLGLDVFTATIGVLGLFAALTLFGISESSVVAIAIFGFHLLTLSVLSVTSILAVVRDPGTFVGNLSLPATTSFGHALFFGFAAAMLGISGFESSANFIEEQKPGVFPKTLRNMWLAVAIFNPLISLLSLGLLPLAKVREAPPDLLAQMGDVSLGPFLAQWVSVDAVLVLSGAVLTSFVGVTGLVRRMALDRCLPQILLQTNRTRGTNHWIIIAFFLVCVNVLVITQGNIATLAGVYALSFLAVMSLFAVGNMLLKVRRNRLPRATVASWPGVLAAFAAALLGIAGSILLDPTSVGIFAAYFAAVVAVVAIMFSRLLILRAVLFGLRSVAESLKSFSDPLRDKILRKMEDIGGVMVYFTRGDNVVMLNRAVLYVLQNEQTNRLEVIHVYRDESDIPPKLGDDLKMLDQLYPEIRIDFTAVKGRFGPKLIDALSRRIGVPKNQMFIGTPGDRFPHRLDELGGVRLIIE
ncbi:MAG TPA: APC family permease [Polyangiaceae bacterium]|nr:APC family permease [Polyangiaceae bacterium]